MGRRGFLALMILAVLLTAVNIHAATEESRLMRFPDIHGDLIVFTYGGDLWTVPSDGGTATRLTTHTGGEGFAKFSPDGSTIAFSGNYDGNQDIYTMDTSGGNILSILSLDAHETQPNWSKDGKKIAYISNESGYYEIWVMDPDGSNNTRITNFGDGHVNLPDIY